MRFIPLIVLTLSSVAWAQNLLKNPSFEQQGEDNQPLHWQVEGAAHQPLQLSSDHYEGAAGAMLVGDGKPRQWRQTVTDVGPVQAFRLSAMLKAEGVVFGPKSQASLYGHIFYKDQPDSSATHFYVRLEEGSHDWRMIEATAQAVTRYTIDKVLVTLTGRFDQGHYIFDQVSLTEAADQTPRALLANKIEDLRTHLRKVATPDESVAAALARLDAATAALDDLDAARAQWSAAARAVSHEMWAAMFPDAMADRPVEAQMLYHGIGRTKEATDRNLDKIELAGCNGVLLSLGGWADVVYHSDVLPVVEGWQEFDALSYFVEEAHRRGIRVYGYLAAFHGSSNPKVVPGNIAHDHPQWMVRRGPDANMPLFPDPAKDEVVDVLVRAYVELATRYKMDGVGLDFIRYPTPSSLSFDEHNRRRILEGFGVDILEGDVTADPARWEKVQQYRGQVIASAVARIRQAVRAASPRTQLIASLSSYPEVAQKYGQNWPVSSAYLDYGSPMNYDDISLDEALIARQRDIFGGHGTLFIPAIGGMPNVHQTWTISEWARRVAVQRRIGCDGIIIYRFGDFDDAVAAFFGKGPFYAQSTFPDPQSPRK